MGHRRVDDIDLLVGRNIRVIRENRRMTQTELGKKIDVTFQQIQKYENGTNRVGSGRLFKIASALRVPIIAFFQALNPTTNDVGPLLVSPEADPLAFRLLQAFHALKNTDLRNSLISIAENLAIDALSSRRVDGGED